jgi:NAD(P)H-nitrite reductase large subunit
VIRLKYVIIGNSAAAVGAVEGIRQADAAGEIILISDEPHHTYSRPLISYLLLGKTTEERMRYRGMDFYNKNQCQLLAPETASSVDASRKVVVLKSGREVFYDKLLIATGSVPLVPPMAGLDTVEKQFTFMTLDDAHALKGGLHKESRVLLIGAGLIGLKCAEGIRASVSSIQVVDLAPRILSSVLDEDGAKFVQNHLEKQGITFYLSNSVERFDRNKATLRDGTEISFDLLVLAVGVRPNTDLLRAAGGHVSRGIDVTEKMETSLPDVYAAGDCTESLDISSGQTKVLALLPNAYLQGECAGLNMAGKSQTFEKAFPMNAVGFFGMHTLTAGTYIGDVYAEQDGDHYKKLFYSDNRLNGFILIDSTGSAGVYTSLIREKIPLDTLNFDLLCKKPGLAAFAQADRHSKLGSVQ